MSGVSVAGRAVIAGEARGPLLRLAPISFWGGIDPETGRVTDPRRAERGRSIAGTVLVLPATIGSSSSSAVMLELLRTGKAPAALVLGVVDPILTMGVIVGREMGYPAIPVVELAGERFAALPADGIVAVHADGRISWDEG